MKTKRTIFSMVIFLTVFWFSIIIFTNNKTDVHSYEPNADNTTIAEYETNNEDNKTVMSDSSHAYAVSSPLNMLRINNQLKPSAISHFEDDNNSDDNEDSGSVESITSTVTESFVEASYNDADTTNDANIQTTESMVSENVETNILGATIAGFGISKADMEILADINPKEFLPKESKYANIGISTAKSYVNIRAKANTESKVLGKLHRDAACEILDDIGNWYYIESGSVTGYVSKKYIKTGIPDEELMEKYGILKINVNVNGLNVRESADVDSDKLTTIYLNEKYHVINLQDEWIKVDISDDKVIGYVKREYVELIVNFNKAISREEEKELLRIKEEERMQKETQIKYRDDVTYTKDELKLLICLVHAEAGNQGYEGKLAVANVVLNRVKSKKYSESIKGVIYQRGQFSVSASGSLDKQLRNYNNFTSKSQKLTIKAVKAAFAGANNIGSRLYFNAYKSAVRKGYDKKPTCVKIEDHLFW